MVARYVDDLRVSCGGACDDFRALLHVTRFAGNRVGPEGARAIGSALERNSTLTSVNVESESARCSESR